MSRRPPVRPRLRRWVLVAAVAAATPAWTDGRAQRTGAFACPDGYTFTASMEDGRVWVFLPQKTVALDPAPAGRFAGDGVELAWNGDRATLVTADGEVRECRNDPERAAWEAAKLRGVDFRAVGGPPPWTVEIGARIELVTEDGTLYAFPLPPPETDRKRRTTRYQATGGGHTLVLELRGEPCEDPATGDRFEVRVTAILDGRKRVGCGRALH